MKDVYKFSSLFSQLSAIDCTELSRAVGTGQQDMRPARLERRKGLSIVKLGFSVQR